MIRRLLPILAILMIGVVLTTAVALMLRQQGALAPVRSIDDPAIRIGGPFSLTDQTGKPVTDRDLLGRPTAIFFGFTYCPEICPTTLASMSRWLDELGPQADRLNVVLITVDPERDTPRQLATYLGNFDPRIRGLTGSVEQIAAVTKAYRVYYKKVPQGETYTVDHSSAIYLFDAKGKFVVPIGYGEPDERAIKALRQLVRS